MGSITTNFTRNLRSYLGAARLGGGVLPKRLVRSTESLTATPVEPIDAVFETIYEGGNGSSLSDRGFHSVADQKLTSSVLNDLIQIQSELSLLDEDAQAEPETLNAKAAQAYQHTQDNFPEPNVTVFSFGS